MTLPSFDRRQQRHRRVRAPQDLIEDGRRRRPRQRRNHDGVDVGAGALAKRRRDAGLERVGDGCVDEHRRDRGERLARARRNGQQARGELGATVVAGLRIGELALQDGRADDRRSRSTPRRCPTSPRSAAPPPCGGIVKQRLQGSGRRRVHGDGSASIRAMARTTGALSADAAAPAPAAATRAGWRLRATRRARRARRSRSAPADARRERAGDVSGRLFGRRGSDRRPRPVVGRLHVGVEERLALGRRSSRRAPARTAPGHCCPSAS